MDFEPGWLDKQITAAQKEINSWSETKKKMMLREAYNDWESDCKEVKCSVDIMTIVNLSETINNLRAENEELASKNGVIQFRLDTIQENFAQLKNGFESSCDSIETFRHRAEKSEADNEKMAGSIGKILGALIAIADSNVYEKQACMLRDIAKKVLLEVDK